MLLSPLPRVRACGQKVRRRPAHGGRKSGEVLFPGRRCFLPEPGLVTSSPDFTCALCPEGDFRATQQEKPSPPTPEDDGVACRHPMQVGTVLPDSESPAWQPFA